MSALSEWRTRLPPHAQRFQEKRNACSRRSTLVHAPPHATFTMLSVCVCVCVCRWGFESGAVWYGVGGEVWNESASAGAGSMRRRRKNLAKCIWGWRLIWWKMNVAPNYFPPPLLMSDPRAPFHPACNFSHFLFYFFSFGKNPSKFITPGQKREKPPPTSREPWPL